MTFWYQYVYGFEDIWGVLLVSVFTLTSITVAFVKKVKVRNPWRIVREQEGATYMLPLVLVIPIYVVLIAMVVECTLLLAQKVGSEVAVFAATRAAAVWLPYESALTEEAADFVPLADRTRMVRLAAAGELFPLASGSSKHGTTEALDDFVTATMLQRISAYRAAGWGTKFDDDYLQRKFQYAYRGVDIKIEYFDAVSGTATDQPESDSKIQVTLRYEAPIHTFGIGRLFGERSRFGNFYVRSIHSVMTIENEGTKRSRAPQSGRVAEGTSTLGIRYYTEDLEYTK